MGLQILNISRKFGLSLSFLALAASSSVFANNSIIVDGKLTREALFDKSIPSSAIAKSIEDSGLKVQEAISKSVRMTPGNHFTRVGEVASFDFVPSSHKNKHAIIYYIPNSIKNELYGKTADVAPVLVLMHGGGASTASYESSKSTAIMYLEDFIQFAEQSKTILIAPSSSLGWTAHAGTFLMREVNALARKELNISGNRMYVFGHSMGAMGLTRTTSNMADEFAGFLPTAGGMPAWGRTEGNLRPYLNINFTHINGKEDHFAEFGPNLLATEIFLKELATKENMPLNFKALFHNGGHNYNLSLTLTELKKLMANERNLYQPKLFGYMGKGVLPNGTPMPIKDFVYPHFFWAKAKTFSNTGATAYSHWNFEVKSIDNAIELINFSGAEHLKEVTLYISSKMLDLSRPVKVFAQGKLLLETNVKANPAKTIDIVRERGDATFLFDESLEIKL